MVFAALAALAVPSFTPITSTNAQSLLSPGLNLGNTLEANPNETAWGNPQTGDAWFASVRRAGFRSVRIPAAWSQYSDAEHRIDPKWMARVKTVVGQAEKAGLYVLLNVHWYGGWLQPTFAARESSTRRLAAFWQQIGTAFRDHGDHLLFAGTNEVHVQGDYGPPAPENAEVQNGFNQTFVTTVRATGGRNRNRWLVVQGYNTDIDHSLKWNLTLPEDSARNRLMMELHYYTPYNFTLNEQSPVWQWGRGASSPAATDGWGNEDFVEDRFRKVQEAFGARGIPVILGEYGAYTKPSRPAGRRYVLRWVRSITEAASRSGMIPMYWDTGTERGIIHRTTGQVQDPELLRALVDSDLRGRGLARVGRSSP